MAVKILQQYLNRMRKGQKYSSDSLEVGVYHMGNDRFIKKLSDWIKIREAEGYPEGKLKEFLLTKGYKIADINKAISMLSVKKKIHTHLSFFKPTFSKVMIMLLLALIIGASFYANKTYMPSYGEQNCELVDYQKDYENANRYAVQLNANPEVLLRELDDLKSISLSVSYDPVWKALGVTYLYSSGLNQFNPWFPIPCPIGKQSFGEGKNCIEYFTPQNRSCVAPVAYSPVGFSNYLIQGILLLIIIYIMLSIFHWLGNFFTDISQHWILIPGIVLLAFMLLIGLGLFDITYNAYLFFILIFLAFFTVEAFTEKIWKRVWTILFILLVVSFPFLSIFDDTTIMQIPENKFEFCNDTITLDAASKDVFFAKNNFGMDEIYYQNINPPVTVCAGCYNTCLDICPGVLNSYSLIGNNPSCVCSCIG
jgi:hypothetical protein